MYRILFLALMLSSCVATTSGTMQEITVIVKDIEQLLPLPGAACQVFLGKELVTDGVTPLKINIKRSHNIYNISCELSGYKNANKDLIAEISREFYDNLANPITFAPAMLDMVFDSDKSYPEVCTILMTIVN